MLEKTSTVHDSTGEEFVEYVEAFFDAQYRWTGEVSGRPAIVNFGKTNPGANATCWKRANFKKEVMVDREKWKHMSNIRRRLLVFHELGHCVLDRKHSIKFVYSDTTGMSIMGSIMFSSTIKILESYTEFQDEYEYELFTNDTSMLEESFDGITYPKR